MSTQHLDSPFLAAANGPGRGATRRCGSCARPAAACPSTGRVRGEGSILDAIKQPDLAAEITLQPVRRYGVDAAVLYSDIVVPAHAVGFGIDVAPGTGPVAARPLRVGRRPRPAAAARARRHRLRRRDRRAASPPSSARDVPLLAFAGAPFTVASYLIEGRAEPRPTSTPRRCCTPTRRCGTSDGAARRRSAVAFIDVQLHAGAQAFQLFDSWAGALVRRRLRALRAAALAAGVRRARRPPSRRRPASTSGSAATTCSRRCAPAGPQVIGLDWRTPIADARRRLGADLVVQGNLDPALVLAGADVALAGARRVLADNGGHPGHIFNLGHGVHPTPTPACSRRRRPRPRRDDRARWLTHAPIGVVLMAYGTPRAPDEIVPYYTDIRRGRPPTDEQLADLTRRYDAIGGHLAARRATEAQRAALQARARRPRARRYVVVLGLKHADPKIEDGVAELAAGGVERIVGLVLAPHYSALSVGQYLGRAERRRRRRTACRSSASRAGPTEPALRRLPRRRRRAAGWRRCRRRPSVVFTAHSLPASASSPPAIRIPTSCGATAAAVAAAVGLDDDRWSIGWQSRRAHARAVARPRHPRRRRRARRRPRRRRRCSCARAASSPTTSRCSTTSTSRPRQRADAAGPGVRPHGVVNADPAVIGALADRVVAAAARRDAAVARRRRRDHRADAPPTSWPGCCPTPSIELREADDAPRRQDLHTSPFAGLPAVDEGADAFLARVPARHRARRAPSGSAPS